MWTLASDQDYDFINDLWETNAAPGFLLGFEIKNATAPTNHVKMKGTGKQRQDAAGIRR